MSQVNPAALFTQLIELESFATSPDARWDTFQNWLKANPKWEKQINKWLQLTPDAAYMALKGHLSKETGIPGMFFDKLITGETEARAIKTIEALQTLYRERKNA